MEGGSLKKCRFIFWKSNKAGFKKHLMRLIVIEDGIDRDWYDCHVYLNPNAKNKSELADFYLDTLNGGYDDPGILGSFLDYMSGVL